MVGLVFIRVENHRQKGGEGRERIMTDRDTKENGGRHRFTEKGNEHRI